jgi:hypothetical protein
LSKRNRTIGSHASLKPSKIGLKYFIDFLHAVLTHRLWRWHKGIPLVYFELALLWKHDVPNPHSPQFGWAFIRILPDPLMVADHVQALV